MKKKRMDRKGIVELQFNWIFVLIAGALITAFFFMIINSQKSTAEKGIGVETSKQLNLLLSTSEINTETVNLIAAPSLTFDFFCDSNTCNNFGCSAGFSIEKYGLTNNIPTSVLFTPTNVKGDYFPFITTEWNNPFKIMNFVYVTSNQYRYIIIDDSTYANQLYNLLPQTTMMYNNQKVKSFDKEMIKRGAGGVVNLVDRNNYKVRIILFSKPIERSSDAVGASPNMVNQNYLDFNVDMRKLQNDYKDITALVVNVNSLCQNQIDCYGEITFLKSNPQKTGFVVQNKTQFLRKASLIGAVITDDFDLYQCNMKKAMMRYSIINNVISERTNLLKSYYVGLGTRDTNQCKPQYGLSFFDTSVNYYSITNAVSLFNNALAIKQRNKRLEQQSCPLIY